MPRKQPPSKTRTIFQVRWIDPSRWKNHQHETFLTERSAGKKFDELAETGIQVELWQTLRPVKLVQTRTSPFDPDRRGEHLANETARRSNYASARWEARRRRHHDRSLDAD